MSILLACHLKFKDAPEVAEWVSGPFYDVEQHAEQRPEWHLLEDVGHRYEGQAGPPPAGCSPKGNTAGKMTSPDEPREEPGQSQGCADLNALPDEGLLFLLEVSLPDESLLGSFDPF